MNRILADENIPRAAILELIRSDLDVSSVAEIQTGMSDLQVLEIARSEERLLWTFDRDFGELIYRRGEEAQPAVVYMRFVAQTPGEPAFGPRSRRGSWQNPSPMPAQWNRASFATITHRV